MMHILPNISRSKGNQKTKFGQLIEYNMEHIFLEASYTKCGAEASPKPFYKISKSKVKRFPVRVRLPAMCRGELSAVISRLMSKCL